MHSNNNQQQPKSTRALIDEIIKELVNSKQGFNEQEFPIAIKDALRVKDLPVDKETVETIVAAVNEQINPTVEGFYSRGQDWTTDTEVEWIWDQWIAKGFFHTITAMQKVGKSTFFLDLIKSICDGNKGFLNFSLFSEKKDLEFVLIGPDMGRRVWSTYGAKSQLLQNDVTTGKMRWHDQIAYVFTEEDRYGLSKNHIARYVEIAKEINARGKHPFFVMDSYSAMMSAAGFTDEENSGQFSTPLRDLKAALAPTGATTLMLHHSSLGGSKRSTAESASGNQTFSRIPDQLLTLKWLAEPGVDGDRADKRIILSASGRTGSTAKPQLLEQSLDWGWTNHGEVTNAVKLQAAADHLDRIMGDDATCWDLISTRTGNGVGTTTNDLQELRETQSGGRGAWSIAKINRLLRKLERKGLVYIGGVKPRPGDLGGTPWNVWWTFERLEEAGFASNGAHIPKNQHIHTGADSHDSAHLSNSARSHDSHTFHDSQDSHVSHVSAAFQSDEDSALLRTRYGDNVPSVRQMVEDENGLNSMVVVELVPETGEVRLQSFGHASAPIKTRRWMVDVFPCGTFVKSDPVPIDLNEEI